jgi:phosphodiesterase/alkaline phosphatase D-like protein
VGHNDVGKVKLRTLLNDLIDFIKRVTHTNVIVLTVDIRYDLKDSHPTLNDEIINFNRKSMDFVKLFPQLSVLEISEGKRLYTNHGLYI